MLSFILVTKLATASVPYAIIVPYHHDVLAPSWERPLCSENYTSSTDLVLFIAKSFYGPEKSVESLDKDKLKCFQNVYITSGQLSEEENVYNKGKNDVDPWWNRGPNYAFISVINYATKNNYTKFFLMETDTVPQRDNWLEELEEYFELDNYYIIGGSISKKLRENWVSVKMPSYYVSHINGNAIYDLKSPVAVQALENFRDYITECWTCGKIGKQIFPYSLSNRMSFDIYLSYLYEMSGYMGYVVEDEFMENKAGIIANTGNRGALFVHQNSGYEFSTVQDFAILNLTGIENKNVCEQTIPQRPFFIVNDSGFDKSSFIPITTDNVKYVLSALPRNSSYCTKDCLEETEFCSAEKECFYINTESVIYWPLDVWIDCASMGELPHGSEYVSLHKDRYVLLDRSKIIVEHPVPEGFSHVPALGASAGRALNNGELAGIIGGSVGGVLLCCCLGYLCRRRNKG